MSHTSFSLPVLDGLITREAEVLELFQSYEISRVARVSIFITSLAFEIVYVPSPMDSVQRPTSTKGNMALYPKERGKSFYHRLSQRQPFVPKYHYLLIY